jgi:ATP-dependent DNA ligase
MHGMPGRMPACRPVVLAPVCVRGCAPPAQDVKLGCAAMPQLSLACFSPADALRRMEGKRFICETKFDGAQITPLSPRSDA